MELKWAQVALPVSTWEIDSLMVTSKSTELAHLSGNSSSCTEGDVVSEESGPKRAFSRALASSFVIELSSSEDSLAERFTAQSKLSGDGGAHSRGSNPEELLVSSEVMVAAGGLL